jgi:hypothetical protein
VKVDSVGNAIGCKAAYPPNRFMQLPSMCKTYLLDVPHVSIEIYIVENEEKVSSKVIKASKFNMRLLIIQDVFLTAHARNISKELIMTQEEKTLFQMLKYDLTEEEAKKEEELCLTFRRLLAGEVVSSDIEGYEQILSCFENGGL